MRAERAVFGSWFATALGVAGVLVPKCPLCAAAYLCLFGVSAGSAQVIAKLGVPLCLGFDFRIRARHRAVRGASRSSPAERAARE